MSGKVISHPGIERWTAKRKAELVLEIIKGHKTIVDAAREYDLKQSEIQKWIDTFMGYGRRQLKSHPKKIESAYEEQLKSHREKIGELVLQIDILKKSQAIDLRGRGLVLGVKALMEREGKSVSLRKISRYLDVAWSTVQYKPKKRAPVLVDRVVEQAIYELIQTYPRYGYRRITVMLRRKLGLVVNRKKVQRLMKRNGWGVRMRFKGFRPRVKSSSSLTQQPNQRWASDMPHFFCKDSGWCHVIAVMDCFNREVIGHRVSRRQDAKTAEGVLEDGLIRRFGINRCQARGVLLRSDNRLIFSSKRYMKLVNRYGLVPEYITPYTPEQNGMIERFMRTLKRSVSGFTASRPLPRPRESLRIGSGSTMWRGHARSSVPRLLWNSN